jgi:ferredoxin
MEELKNNVRQALESGEISGFLGLKEKDGQVSPLFITANNLDDIDSLISEVKGYPLGKILKKIAGIYPDKVIGVMADDVIGRSVTELIKAQQLDDAKVVKFEVPARQPEDGTGAALLEKIENMPLEERLSYWMAQFGKCIKCYGCRNICPVCNCTECTLEDKNLIKASSLPTDIPVFHLIKAIHMTDRCIDCGLCEQTCPANIPLRTIYRHMGKTIKELFDYEPGQSIDDKSPLNVLEEREVS